MGGDQLAVAAATRRLQALRARRSVSMRFRVGGRVVIAEGRALTTGGAVVLARTEAPARRLATGERDVRLERTGPAEVVQVADAVNALAGSLAASEARQRDFLPLTAIRGFAESLADGVTTGERVAPVGRTILAESERLQHLVGDLLDLARLDADDLSVESLPVDLTGIVAEAGHVWRERCAATGQRLVVEVPDEPLVVHTDPVPVRQVLDGLAENPVRVTALGQPVVLAVRGEGQRAVVEVRDGGPGLTDDDLAVAFDRSALHRRYAGRAEAGHAPEGRATFRLVLPMV